jgi:glycine/D-amino acid oxidase-like deaminating enzyme
MMFGLGRDDVYDVVVIGNGALGASLAYALRKQDSSIKIAIIGPSARPGAATTTAGAMINVWAEIAAGQFDNPALADRAELPIEAMGLWDALCAELSEFSEQPLKVTWGTYLINNALGSPHEERAVDYILQIMQQRGVAHRLCKASDVAGLNPEAKAQPSRIVHLPDGRIDPRPVLAAYERFFAARSVDMFDTVVTGLSADSKAFLGLGSGDRSLTLADGRKLRAKNVVLANGSFAQELIDQIPDLKRETPRLVWGAGSAMDLSMPAWVKKYGGLDRRIFDIDSVIRTVDRGGACGVHMIPFGDGEFYLGASSGVWFEPEFKPRIHAIHVLMRSVVEEINYGFFFGTFGLRGPGFRPVSMDTFPLLGQSHIKGIWFANGTKRDGFTCSPLIARELATEILGGKSKLPPRFKPSRKLISYKTLEAALDDSAAGDFGGEIQHGLNLPPYAIEPYRQAKRARAAATYEKRKIANFGIHPEVLHLYDNDDFFAVVDHPRESAG